MRALMRATLLAACAALAMVATSALAAQYEYDALNRVTKVTYANGHSISYRYDPAGNIISVITVGRSCAQVAASLGNGHGNGNGDHDWFSFRASKGETVTLRFEADPPQAGLGKYVVMNLKGKAEKGKGHDEPKVVRDDVLSAVPAELTTVLPFTGEFTVDVRHAGDVKVRYRGPYRLTLEASPGACASFEPGH